jgi:serpin B
MQAVFGWADAQFVYRLGQKAAAVLAAATGSGMTLLVANRMFARATVRQDYVQSVSAALGANVVALRSAQEVNSYVSEATRGMVREIVDDDIVSQSCLVAINAIYFKGTWQHKFDPTWTVECPWHSHIQQPHKGVPGTSCFLMRSAERKWRYHEDDHYQYVLLPYASTPAGHASEIAALVALPKLVTCTRPMDGLDVAAACARLVTGPEHTGSMWIPRFKVGESGDAVNLAPPLQSLGVRSAFADDADFSGLSCEPLIKIDMILQKVVIAVDEQGTEAAAATAACMVFGCAAPPPDRFSMRCDRPFAFCVVHLPSALCLFSGAIMEPGRVGAVPTVSTAWSAPAAPLSFAARSQPAAAPFGPPAASPFGPPAASPFGTAPRRERGARAHLFTPACLRDVYRVLCTPPRRSLLTQPHQKDGSQPNFGFPPPAASGGAGFGFGLFGAPPEQPSQPAQPMFRGLFSARPEPSVASGWVSGFGFGSPPAQPLFGGSDSHPVSGFGRPALVSGFNFGRPPLFGSPPAQPLFGGSNSHPPVPSHSPRPPVQWVWRNGHFERLGAAVNLSGSNGSLNDPAAIEHTLNVISQIGKLSPEGMEVTAAFESLLVTDYVPWWSDADAASLSTSFIVAFGLELTPRLDLAHAVRSRALPAADVAWLRTLSTAVLAGVTQNLLDTYQT